MSQKIFVSSTAYAFTSVKNIYLWLMLESTYKRVKIQMK